MCLTRWRAQKLSRLTDASGVAGSTLGIASAEAGSALGVVNAEACAFAAAATLQRKPFFSHSDVCVAKSAFEGRL